MKTASYPTYLTRKKNMTGSWGCPHEIGSRCHKVNGLAGDPGMKGCVLDGRYVFASAGKNERLLQKRAQSGDGGPAPAVEPDDQPRE